MNNYTGLAEFRAVLDRLSSFDESIERARALKRATKRIKVGRAPRGGFAAAALTLHLPDGRVLPRIEHTTLNAGEPALLLGASFK